MKIYLVEGCTGKYEDYHSWIAKAFKRQSSAVAFKKKLDAICEAFGDVTIENYSDLGELLRKVDIHGYADYTGVTYEIVPLSVVMT
jgi:hypothetical protein